MDWLLDFILSTLGTILYPLFSIIFLFVQLLQTWFRAFAGVGEGLYFKGQAIGAGNTGADNDTGLIYFLFRNELVQNLLTSIALLSIFLLLIFTAMAFIKNVYTSKPKTWQEIVGNAFKGLANFVFIPVCCLLGIWLGNILLNAIDGATSVGGSVYLDRKLFIASAYNANKVRAEGQVTDTQWIQDLVDNNVIIGTENEHVEFDANHDKNDIEYFAGIIDQVYSETSIGITWYGEVEQGYYLWDFNYLTLIVGGIFLLYVLGSLTFGMIKRMYMLVVMFVVSPAACAYYPLDDGGATGKWKGAFVKEVISVYGSIAGLNIFFSLMPLIDNLSLSAGWGATHNNSILTLVLLVCGLYVVKDLISTIGGFFGMDNTYSSGASLMKSAGGALNKYATKPVATGAFRLGGAAMTGAKAKEGGGVKGFFKGLGSEAKEMGKESLFGKKKPGDAWYNREGGLLGKAYGAMGVKGSDLESAWKSSKDRADAQKKWKAEDDAKKHAKNWIDNEAKEGTIDPSVEGSGESLYNLLKTGARHGAERDKILGSLSGGNLDTKAELLRILEGYEEELEKKRAAELRGGSGGSGGTGGTGGGGTGGTGGGGTGGGDTIIHNHYYGSSGESGEIRTIDRTGDFYISELDGAKITMDNARTDIANAGVARAGAQSGLDEAYAALVKFAEEKMKPLEGSAAVRRNMHRIESGEVGINHLDINALEHTRLRDFVPELTQLLDTYKQKRAELNTAEQAELATQKAYEAVVRKTIGNIDHMSEQFTDIKKHLQEFDDATRKSKEEMDEFIEAVKKAIKK